MDIGRSIWLEPPEMNGNNRIHPFVGEERRGDAGGRLNDGNRCAGSEGLCLILMDIWIVFLVAIAGGQECSTGDEFRWREIDDRDQRLFGPFGFSRRSRSEGLCSGSRGRRVKGIELAD